jgi:hypothetical protein
MWNLESGMRNVVLRGRLLVNTREGLSPQCVGSWGRMGVFCGLAPRVEIHVQC